MNVTMQLLERQMSLIALAVRRFSKRFLIKLVSYSEWLIRNHDAKTPQWQRSLFVLVAVQKMCLTLKDKTNTVLTKG